MSTFLTGDTHGDFTRFSSDNFPIGKTLTKDDQVIILGDFGLIWNEQLSKSELYWKHWLEQKPWTTFAVLGNHENYSAIEQYPTVNMFGGKVYKISEKIFLFQTGEIYWINGQSFFVCNGAYSVDKPNRTEYDSWWSQEQPTYSQMENGLYNLEMVSWSVDYILAHTCPEHVGRAFNKSYNAPDVEDWISACYTAKYLSEVVSKTQFKKFFFGHYHPEEEVWNYQDMYHCLFTHILQLNEGV
jgi:predicted phosphohydrolase